MPLDPFRFEVLPGERVLEELAAAWHSLWLRCGGSFHEGVEACRAACEQVARPGGSSVWVVLAWQGPELVLVWPWTSRSRGLVRVLRPLGPGMADPTPLLISPGCERLLRTAWDALLRALRPDVVHVTCVLEGTPLHVLARDYPGARSLDVSPLAVAHLRDGPSDLASLERRLGKLASKKKPGQLRRKLERAGQLGVRVVSGIDASERAPALVDFVLAHKRAWAGRLVQPGPWLREQAFRDYLLALLGPHGGSAARALWLELDGQPIACAILGLGATRVVGLISGFDEAFARFSPGLVLVEECVRAALAWRLDFDFGVGSEPYKLYWSSGLSTPAHTLAVPTTLRGRLALGGHTSLRVARAGLKARFAELKSRLAGWGAPAVVR